MNKLSIKAQKVLDRILNGDIPKQTHVTGSLVRGIKAGKQSILFPNGEKVHPAIIESLSSADLIERKTISKFGTWGYMESNYGFYPKGKAPEGKPEENYVL